MKRVVTCLGALALLGISSLGQNSPKTESPIADIRETNPNGLLGVQGGFGMSGPYVGGGLYRVRNASMLELIAAAYGVGVDKVGGGPSWIGFNRYDVTAKLPAGATPETIKTMLQALLADRFNVAAHAGEAPLEAWAITANVKQSLKPSSGTGGSGCQRQKPPAGSQPPQGVDLYECRNITMQQFAEAIPKLVAPNALNGYAVYDRTNLKGAWDFDLTYRIQVGTPNGQEPLSFFDALPKVGLALKLTKQQLPAFVVESVNSQPTANPPNLDEFLPKVPTAFDVAEIKPVGPNDSRRGYTSNVQPGGVGSF